MEDQRKITAIRKIINQLIEKGGLYGQIAEIYRNDYEKASVFIIECAKQCVRQNMVQYWEENLIKEILEYKSDFGNSQTL